MKKSGIYMILNVVNMKSYIGSTNNLKKRGGEHFRLLVRKMHHNQHLQKAVTKYGLESFKFIELEEIETNKLIEREKYWIENKKTLDRRFGYNLQIPDTETLFKMSEETKHKIKKFWYNKNCEDKNVSYEEWVKRKDKVSTDGRIVVIKGSTGECYKVYSSKIELVLGLMLDSKQVQKVLDKERKSYKGLVFIRHKNYDELKSYRLSRAKYKTKGITSRVYKSQQTDRTVLKINKDTQEIVAKFNNPKLAAEEIDANVKYIYKVMQGSKNSYKGYMYKYETYIGQSTVRVELV